MSTASQNTPQTLLTQLRGFRRHVVILKITEVLVAATFGLLAAWLVVMIAERFVELATWQRLGLLAAGVAGFAVGLPWALHRWFWRTRQIKSVAQLLSAKFPMLSDEIVSVLELSKQDHHGASTELIAAAMEQTGQDAQGKDFIEATPAHRRPTWTVLAAVAVIATLIAVILFPSAASNAWLRFANPWTQTSRFTFTQIAPLPDRKVVPYGEEFLLEAGLLPESEAQPQTGTATLGRFVVAAERDGDRYAFKIPGQTTSGALTVSAGDCARSVTIVPETRPEMTEVVAEIMLPDYLQITEPKQIKSLNGRFRVAQGSRVSFTVSANRELASATMDQHPIATVENSAKTLEMTIDQNQQHQIQWQDEFGMTASGPIALEIQAIQDRSPNCSLQRILQPVVLVDQAIELAFSAIDDYGIRHVGIQWEGIVDPVNNPNPAKGETILFAGGSDVASIQSSAVLTPQRENIAPQPLTLRLFTEDFRPGGTRAYSLPQTVHVMSAQQHVAWVTEQMKRWKSRSDAVYERELALGAENRQLQSLSDKELATNENIRRLEEQAAAERENSERLKQVIEKGRLLIQQALRNKNMRADQVARWSQSLTRLKAIAGNRMEELSRRLTQLADELSYQSEVADQVPNAAVDGAKEKKRNAKKDSQKNKKAQLTDSKKQKGTSNSEGSESQENDQDDDDTDKTAAKKDNKKRYPSLKTEEETMLEDDPEQSEATEGSKKDNDSKKRKKNRIGLPETLLRNPNGMNQKKESDGSQKNKGEKEAKKSKRPVIDGIVEDHERLLEEFREARKAMDDLLAEFQNSTFVKRLKAASQSQLSLANQLNHSMSVLFGDVQQSSPVAPELLAKLSAAQAKMFEQMSEIEGDLKAYQSRDPDAKRQQVLDDMQSLNMRVKLEEMPIRLRRKLNGDTLHRSEFWADTFDRWAEELVPPQRSNGGKNGGGGGGGGGNNPSIPPAIVLEIMRLIDDQTQLRDETRTLEQARKAMEETEVDELLGGLTVYQLTVNDRAIDTIEDVRRLPNSMKNFDDELKKLGNSIEAMGEASSMLVDRMTGQPTVAAETAAIEALLSARRSSLGNQKQKDRKNGDGDGSESLADLDSPFDILQRDTEPEFSKLRDVGAALGGSVDGVPDAYRSGLNSFQNQLRKLDQMQN